MKTCISPVDQSYKQPDPRDSSILRCYATWNCKQFPTFWRTVVSLPSQSSNQVEVEKLLELSPWIWRHYDPCKCLTFYQSTCIMSQKSATKTSNVTT
jgi:hypothetical protein